MELSKHTFQHPLTRQDGVRLSATAKISTLLTLLGMHSIARVAIFRMSDWLKLPRPCRSLRPYRSALGVEGQIGMDRPVTSRGTAVQHRPGRGSGKVQAWMRSPIRYVRLPCRGDQKDARFLFSPSVRSGSDLTNHTLPQQRLTSSRYNTLASASVT